MNVSAEIIICMNKRKSAACRTFMATPLPTRNFFSTHIIKIRVIIDHQYQIMILPCASLRFSAISHTGKFVEAQTILYEEYRASTQCFYTRMPRYCLDAEHYSVIPQLSQCTEHDDIVFDAH
jgi:hypothetical protein